MFTRRKPRPFTEELKNQMVDLHQSSKPRKDFIEDYDLTPSAFDKGGRQCRQSGSFKGKRI